MSWGMGVRTSVCASGIYSSTHNKEVQLIIKNHSYKICYLYNIRVLLSNCDSQKEGFITCRFLGLVLSGGKKKPSVFLTDGHWP